MFIISNYIIQADSYTIRKGQGNELESLIGQMQRVIERVIDSLPEGWEGDAAITYVEQFASLKPGLEKPRQLVEDIAVQIDQTLQAVQELDANIASKLR